MAHTALTICLYLYSEVKKTDISQKQYHAKGPALRHQHAEYHHKEQNAQDISEEAVAYALQCFMVMKLSQGHYHNTNPQGLSQVKDHTL